MSNIKSVNISGSAAKEMGCDSIKKDRKRRTKKNQAGGMNLIKGIESETSVATTAASSNSNTWLKYPDTTGTPVPPRINVQPAYTSVADKSAAPTNQYTQLGATSTQMHGGTKHIKVELKKKKSIKNVNLNPKKVNITKSYVSKNQTRKNRKVTLGISALHKRMTRAKKLHKKMKEMPIETLKEKLIKGGLIKNTSKAPESVLRQIAIDSHIVAGKAL